MTRSSWILIPATLALQYTTMCQTTGNDVMRFSPRPTAQADSMAREMLPRMTTDEKCSYVGGDKSFFIRAIPRLGLREVYMTDATQGVHIRQSFGKVDLSMYQLERSTAFPCPILLAATWDPELAYYYAQSIGEECRAGGIGVLLGPGLNCYRISQYGRNFEYFGEDPYLRSRLVEQYVRGVQSTGTIATLKHFVGNNTDFFRRKSNSIIDERTLHEIYLPPFKAGIDAGACAVMTSYNLLNGEWCSESKTVISVLLRNDLAFNGLVMTDWWAVYDGKKLAASGQDLEMPKAIALEKLQDYIAEGTVQMADIERMVLSILRTYFLMRLDERQHAPEYLERLPAHAEIALRTAREGIVLLKNDNRILPISTSVKSILLTGFHVDTMVAGGGSAEVKGYGCWTMLQELTREFGERIHFLKQPTDEDIRAAEIVLCNVGTADHEGADRPFALPEDQEMLVKRCVTGNPNTVVVVTSGSGIRMTDWSDKAKAILYAWYAGQNGNSALAEILAGKTNPCGKLPITIEKEFADSPGAGYLPGGEQLYTGWNADGEKAHPVYDVRYDEGIFVGYRWYEKKNIQPLFPFGHGLSYTSYAYHGLDIAKKDENGRPVIAVSFTVRNTGMLQGTEVAQVYLHDVKSSVPRPAKELKGFKRILLKPGQEKTVTLELRTPDFSFWKTESHSWRAEPGVFRILVGSSSAEILLVGEVAIDRFDGN
jgi:beta-glucosidase